MKRQVVTWLVGLSVVAMICACSKPTMPTQAEAEAALEQHKPDFEQLERMLREQLTPVEADPRYGTARYGAPQAVADQLYRELRSWRDSAHALGLTITVKRSGSLFIMGGAEPIAPQMSSAGPTTSHGRFTLGRGTYQTYFKEDVTGVVHGDHTERPGIEVAFIVALGTLTIDLDVFYLL